MAEILKDEEILDLVRKGNILNVPGGHQDLDTRTSKIQPSSLDLTIGKIFLPGSEAKDSGSGARPITDQYSLKPGETAVVEAAEEFHLPDEIGAFGFPPARVSGKGLLMTNPGHVDPGYDGSVSFTVVNMGREHYGLVCGGDICTLLFYRLAKPHKSYREREGGSPKQGMARVLEHLSPDFLNVAARAEAIAESARLRFTSWQVFGPFLAAVFAAVISLGGVLSTTVFDVFKTQEDLENKIELLESRLEVDQVQQQVAGLQSQLELEERIGTLEEQLSDLTKDQQ